MGVGRKMRILLVSVGNKTETLSLLGKWLVRSGHVVRICKVQQEFEDLVKKPNCDFGLAIVLKDTDQGVISHLGETVVKLLEFHEGRCNLTKLQNDIEKEISTHGRY